MTQLALFTGKRKRDDGIKRAADNNSFVLSLLRIHALKLAATQNVSSDDLREYAKQEGLNVTHQNAWGAIVNSIFRAKDGWIEVGRKQSEIEGNHARKITVYRLEVR